ncbi:MAG: FCD domain-containing protein [Thermomicrobiales bacterium]
MTETAGEHQGQREEHIALRLLEASEMPVGAARLARAWREQGLVKGDATAGRLLRSLDERGLTEQRGVKQGRRLTAAGLALLRKLDERERRTDHDERIWDAVRATDLDDLIDLLRMRMLVETEAAQLAAARGSDAELASIVANAHTHVHERDLPHGTAEPSMSFHRLVVQASHSRILAAVGLMLLDDSLDPLERLLERITLDAGSAHHQVSQHLGLAEAIRERRVDDAARLMGDHMREMLEGVEAYRSSRADEGA